MVFGDIPTHNGIANRNPNRLLIGMFARNNIIAARHIANTDDINGDWIIAGHLSEGFVKTAKPRTVSLCLLHSKGSGFWIGSRGRKIMSYEASGLQGFRFHNLIWPKYNSHCFGLIGNSMSICQVQRLLIKVLHHLGQCLDDP